MLKAKKSLHKFHRNNKIMAIVCGVIYAMYGLLNIGMVALQEKFLNNADLQLEGFSENFIGPMHQNIKVMMPYLIAIGMGFIILGVLFKKVKSSRLALCLILLIACILWSSIYIKNGIEQLGMMYDQMEGLVNADEGSIVNKFSDASRYMGTMGLFMSFVYMVGPVAILTLRIKLNDAEE